MNRFDNALKKLDASANSRTGDRRAEFNGSEAKFLAAVLRAGRELADVVDDHLNEDCTPEDLLSASLRYDHAVAGTNAIAGGGDE